MTASPILPLPLLLLLLAWHVKTLLMIRNHIHATTGVVSIARIPCAEVVHSTERETRRYQW